MRRGFITGCFDVLHVGHIAILKYSKSHCDHLTVALDTDERVSAAKGPNRPFNTLSDRKAVIKSIKYVDEVIPDAPLLIDEKWIKKHDIDMIVHGDDWEISKLQNIYKIPIEMGIFKTVPHTPSISTTDIIKRLNN